MAMLPWKMSVWEGLHMLPRIDPSARAKLCTYFRWFARPDRVLVEPHYEVPMSITKLKIALSLQDGLAFVAS